MSKFNVENFNIIVIGAGGTGGNLLPMLAKLIKGREDVSITIVDGDDVELKNLERQPFLSSDIGLNKAQVLSDKLNMAFDLNTSYVPVFINELSQLESIAINKINTLNIIIGAVDNHNCRIVLEKFFNKQRNVVYIDSANEDYFGDVIMGVKFNNTVFHKTRGMYRPMEVFSGTKRVKNTSCLIKVNENPQHLPANMMAATIVLKLLSDVLVENDVRVTFINFDTHEYNMFAGEQGIEKDCFDTYKMYFDGTLTIEVKNDV